MSERNNEDVTQDELQVKRGEGGLKGERVDSPDTAESEIFAARRAHAENVNNVALQALQNAVETANMVGKNAAGSMNNAQQLGVASLGTITPILGVLADKLLNPQVSEMVGQRGQLREGEMGATAHESIRGAQGMAAMSMPPILVERLREVTDSLNTISSSVNVLADRVAAVEAKQGS